MAVRDAQQHALDAADDAIGGALAALHHAFNPHEADRGVDILPRPIDRRAAILMSSFFELLDHLAHAIDEACNRIDGDHLAVIRRQVHERMQDFE